MSPAERAGARLVRQLQDAMTEREWLVIGSIAEHRFLTTTQIEALHFEDGHASRDTAARACRKLLKRLYDFRIITRLDRRIGGVRAGSASFIWTLGPVGDRLLLGEGGRRRRTQEPSLVFLDHTLAVADLRVELERAQRRARLELVEIETEPACWRDYIGPGGARLTLRPDLFVMTASGHYEDRWFIEVDRATESTRAIIKKCAAYEAYRRTGVEQNRHGTFPIVVWQVPTKERLGKLRHALRHTTAADPALFRLVVVGDTANLLRGSGEQ